jgi:hypothetical protein
MMHSFDQMLYAGIILLLFYIGYDGNTDSAFDIHLSFQPQTQWHFSVLIFRRVRGVLSKLSPSARPLIHIVTCRPIAK